MTWNDEARKSLNQGKPVAILNAQCPTCLLRISSTKELTPVSLIVKNNKISQLSINTSSAPKINLDEVTSQINMNNGMIWPCFTDIHTHLDKGHIWPRRPNPDGTFEGALKSVGEDRQVNWAFSDVEKRMRFSLKCAHTHGTKAIRTHLDSIGPQINISWAVFEKMRDEWAGRIELQASSLFGIDNLEDPKHLEAVLRQVIPKRGILGAVTYPAPRLDHYLDQLFAAANEHGLTLDFHADETRDPNSDCLHQIARAAKRHSYRGKVLVGHCCSLARQQKDQIDRTLDLVAEAGLAIVSLPLCNMYLQDRSYDNSHPVTPRWRGVTLLHEMKKRGIPVMIASDNTRDPFYAYGDMDALEIYREATRIAHLDHPVGDWPLAVTGTPAHHGEFEHKAVIEQGMVADFILLRARSWSELLSRPQNDRVVVRSGQALTSTLPDYRELDEVVGPPQSNLSQIEISPK